jgi:hypothetical protein
VQKFDPLLPGGAEAARIPVRHHVDDSIFGVVPLEIAIQTKDPKYLADGVGGRTGSGKTRSPMAFPRKRAIGLTTCIC